MLPIGVESFEKLRRNDMYYVDKTEIIADLLRNHGDANLFTRPRRFGKTLTMDTLKTFFEIGKAAYCRRISASQLLSRQYCS